MYIVIAVGLGSITCAIDLARAVSSMARIVIAERHPELPDGIRIIDSFDPGAALKRAAEALSVKGALAIDDFQCADESSDAQEAIGSFPDDIEYEPATSAKAHIRGPDT